MINFEGIELRIVDGDICKSNNVLLLDNKALAYYNSDEEVLNITDVQCVQLIARNQDGLILNLDNEVEYNGEKLFNIYYKAKKIDAYKNQSIYILAEDGVLYIYKPGIICNEIVDYQLIDKYYNVKDFEFSKYNNGTDIYTALVHFNNDAYNLTDIESNDEFDGGKSKVVHIMNQYLFIVRDNVITIINIEDNCVPTEIRHTSKIVDFKVANRILILDEQNNVYGYSLDNKIIVKQIDLCGARFEDIKPSTDNSCFCVFVDGNIGKL